MAMLPLLFAVISMLVLPATRVCAADGPTAGLIVGATLASVGLSGSGATFDTGFKGGVSIGGFGLFPLTSKVAIRPEAAYARNRFTLKDSARGFDAKDVWDWFEVPILLHVRFTSDSSGPYVVGGPGFGFLWRAKEREGRRTLDIEDAVQKVDVSMIGGAGYAAGSFGIEARFEAGMRDLNKHLGGDIGVKSRTVRINVTWTP